MNQPPVPFAVYLAARRLYLNLPASEAIVRAWAAQRWPTRVPVDVATLALWVLSIAFQDGREGTEQ